MVLYCTITLSSVVHYSHFFFFWESLIVFITRIQSSVNLNYGYVSVKCRAELAVTGIRLTVSNLWCFL